MAHDVFISFSFKDQEIADKISNQLTNMYNIPCWICNAGVRGGSRFYADIVRAIKAAKIFLLVQTKNSVVSQEVVDEILEAIHNQEVKIVPFVLEDSDLNDLDINDEDQKLTVDFKLRGIQRVDGRKDPLDDRIKELAQELCRVLGRPFENTESKSERSEYILSSNIVEPARDDIFIGRDALMDEIHASFERHNTVFLQGMGGIGKSELAKQYYYKYKSDESEGNYNKVIFARFDGNFAALIADDLIFNIKGVSRKTNKNNEQQSDEEYAREKIKILKNICDNRTLFIIDNFDVDADDEKLFAEFIDKAPYRVLVTTRIMQTDYKMISVKELDDESLKSIFIKYFGEEGSRVSRDDPAFDDLFEWTDRHTLTIELIAKYMKSSRRITSIRDMLDTLSSKHLAVFSEAQKRQSQKNSYDRISDILRVSELNDDDVYFLRCLSLMPDIGYIDFFEKWIRRDSDAELYWDDVLDKLSSLSIVKESISSGLVYLHPIMREVVINELKPSYEICKDFIDRCAMVGTIDTIETWGWTYDQKKQYLDCLEEIIQFIHPISADNYPIYCSTAIFKNYISNYNDTIIFHEQIHEFATSCFGENSVEAMRAILNMGWKSSNAGFFDEAKHYINKVVEWCISSKSYHTQVGHESLMLYGELCVIDYNRTHNQASINTALEYFKLFEDTSDVFYQHNLKKDESNLYNVKFHIDSISRAYIKLYFATENYIAAEEELLKYKKAIEEHYLGVGETAKVDMASWFQKYGRLNFIRENYNTAIEALKESYQIYYKFFSLKNVRVIQVLEEIAVCFMKLNNFQEADKYLTLAIEGASAVFTEDHPTLVRLLELKKQYGS